MTNSERQAALNLLAVMHRDGGHHTARVGFVQSCLDAETRRHHMLANLDRASNLIAALFRSRLVAREERDDALSRLDRMRGAFLHFIRSTIKRRLRLVQAGDALAQRALAAGDLAEVLEWEAALKESAQ